MSKHSTIHQTTSCLTATQIRTILPTQHRPPTIAKRRENSPGAVTIETATRQHDLRLGIRKQGKQKTEQTDPEAKYVNHRIDVNKVYFQDLKPKNNEINICKLKQEHTIE